MDLRTYKLVMRAMDLALRTFGNQAKKGPVMSAEFAGHCDMLSIRFHKEGWTPDANPTAYACIGFQWAEDDDFRKMETALDCIEGEIKAWEKLNGGKNE